MKNFIIYSLISLLLFSSCDDFLEQESQDLIIPENATHYSELLVGEGSYKKLMDNGWFIETMTDNIELYVNPSDEVVLIPNSIIYGEGAYLWQSEIEDELIADKLYKHIYSNILAANTCLTNLPDIKGTNEEKLLLKGQASFVRAYGYFLLANLYSQSYNEAQPTDLCVPIVTDPRPTLEKFKRNTVKEVWDLIQNDINTAVELLSKNKKFLNVYQVNYKAALLLGQRIALFKEEYDKVISLGEEFLKIHPSLYDITGGLGSDESFLDPTLNDEIVFNFGGKYEYAFIHESTGLAVTSFRTSEGDEGDLMPLFSNEDARKKAFFKEPEISLWLPLFNKEVWLPKKYDRYAKTGLRQCFRSAEVYLSMAEAYASKTEPNNNLAIQMMNNLCKKRISGYVDVAVSDFAQQKDLLTFIYNERRKEFCFEEFHRWWDLRRLGQPTIKHNWTDSEEFVLNEKDKAYILNFPISERNYNDNLVGNPRPVRTSVK